MKVKRSTLIFAFVICILIAGIGCQKSLSDEKPTQPGVAAEINVDFDLSMSETMTYSGLSQIYEQPDSYLGRVISIKGKAASVRDEIDGKIYHACVCFDATACCNLAMEYVLDDGNYPTDNKDIVVTGTLEKYQINGSDYYTLNKASVR